MFSNKYLVYLVINIWQGLAKSSNILLVLYSNNHLVTLLSLIWNNRRIEAAIYELDATKQQASPLL